MPLNTHRPRAYVWEGRGGMYKAEGEGRMGSFEWGVRSDGGACRMKQGFGMGSHTFEYCVGGFKGWEKGR